MQGLTALLRQAQAPAVTQGLRAFGTAAKDVLATSGNPFLRFSTPYPKAIDHSPLLSTLPETQVR